MERISVCRNIEFEAAHMLEGYNGGCGSLHGHSYKISMIISCPENVRKNNDFGFVLDFKELNKVLNDNVPDHMFMYNKNNGEDTVEGQIVKILKQNNLRLWAFNNTPSAENMVKELAENFQQVFDNLYPEKDIKVDELRLWETTNSHSIWKRG
ncbi:MAG: 6-carboxytetrahydropterin synthase [Methanobrevibacter sp.]|nr:6-carboxytetrahydropterin synthase [Methanobrevibacter sp.]MBO7692135.1 6-carboxytetrahydropterin synthase [Methanobrevibacter sp.]